MMPRVDRSAPAPSGGGTPPNITAVGAPAEPPEEPRSAGDILRRSLRVTLGGTEYVMAVLFIAGNERWRAFEERTSAALIARLEDAGDDTHELLSTFADHTDTQLDLLYAYDTDSGTRPGVLPPRDELKERIYEHELDYALREVVKAANPKAAGAVDLMTVARLMSDSSQPSNTPPPSTAGRPRRSAKH